MSLCMIVQNEEHYLARCVHSAGHLAAEMIIADTGSTDRTQEIAAAFGAKLFDIPWEGDFAKARNAAFAAASRKWILVLDADEAISTRDVERLASLLVESASNPAAFRVRTRNYTFHASTVGWRANDGAYPDEEQGLE